MAAIGEDANSVASHGMKKFSCFLCALIFKQAEIIRLKNVGITLWTCCFTG